MVNKKSHQKKQNQKKKVSILLEQEVIDYFKDRAKKPNAAPYQTQINNELRRIMEQDNKKESTEMIAWEKQILDDESFLKALKEKLQKI